MLARMLVPLMLLAPAAPAAEPSGSGPPRPSDPLQQRVTLDFKNADLQDVLRLIADRAGLNLLMNPAEVRGAVTLQLRDVPLGAALESILKTNRLAMITEETGMVRVVDDRRAGVGSAERTTEAIPLAWRDGALLSESLRPHLTPWGEITFEPGSNTLLITDMPAKIAELKRLIVGDRPVGAPARAPAPAPPAEPSQRLEPAALIDLIGEAADSRRLSLAAGEHAMAQIPVSDGRLTLSVAAGRIDPGDGDLGPSATLTVRLLDAGGGGGRPGRQVRTTLRLAEEFRLAGARIRLIDITPTLPAPHPGPEAPSP